MVSPTAEPPVAQQEVDGEAIAKSTTQAVGYGRPPRPAPGTRFGGRAAGVPNKSTATARAAIGAFVDNNAERLEELLEEIREVEGPKAAWDCIMSVVEYHVPKLARTELTGKDGAPITISAAPTDNKL